MNDQRIYAVVMAGGSGTRFWPASRAERPKQFLSIVGESSMLAATVARISPIVPLERTLVVTSAAHVDLVRESLPDLPSENILAESIGRNTLPCVAWATLEIARREPDALQVVLPADHVIPDQAAFERSVRAAIEVAATRHSLVTFGIRPTHAATGYGYIETADQLTPSQGEPVARVKRFVEKPNAERATEFLKAGSFLWNSGIFVWENSAILDALRTFAPNVLKPLESAAPDARANVYETLPSESIDVGVMEQAETVDVLPIDYAWSDVGSWEALADLLVPDADGNSTSGNANLVTHDAHNCLAYAEDGSLTALIGVDDLVVVRTARATLVCPKSRAQEVRAIVAQLEQADRQS